MTSGNDSGPPQTQSEAQDGSMSLTPSMGSVGEKGAPVGAGLDELFDRTAKAVALGDSGQATLGELVRLAEAKAVAGDPDAGAWAVGRLASQFAGMVGPDIARFEPALLALAPKPTPPFVRKAFERYSTREGVEACLGFAFTRMGERRLEVKDTLLPRLARDLSVDPFLVVARTLAQAPDELLENPEWVEAWGRFANREYSRKGAKAGGTSVDELLWAMLGLPKTTASTAPVQEFFLSLCDDFPEVAAREQGRICASPLWTLLEREHAYRGRVMDLVRGHSTGDSPAGAPAGSDKATSRVEENGQESRLIDMVSRLEKKLEERTVLTNPVTRDLLHKLPPMVQASVGIFVGYIDEMLGDARKKDEMTRQAQAKVHQLQSELENSRSPLPPDLQSETVRLRGELERSRTMARDSVHHAVNGERSRQIIEREIGNFNQFLETVDPEDPIARAFIEQFRLRAECLQSRFPNLERSKEERS